LKLKSVFAAALVVAAAVAIAFSSDDTSQGTSAKKPFDPALHGNAAKTGTTQILYHNGPVMHPVSVYVIYYGDFSSSTAPGIVDDFLGDLNNSKPYFVNTTYNDPAQPNSAYVQPNYTFTPPAGLGLNTWDGSVYFDTGSQGTQIRSSTVQKIVANAVGSTPDRNGIYILVSAPNIKVSGFCTSFCAYHSSSTSIVAGHNIRYALVPDPSQKCTTCNGGIAVYNDKVTPNGDMGADTVTDDIMHELSETVTDPDINAWYTQGGAEVGDLCNYVYDTTPPPANATLVYTTGTGAHANFQGASKRDYLIQLIWKNSGVGFCAAN